MSENLPGLSTMSLKKDMLHIQDEILRDMRQMQTKLDAKYSKSEEDLNTKLTKFELKIKNLEKKISELSNLITQDNSMKEKLESLFQFKEEIQDTIFKRRAKLADLEKKFNSEIDGINKILTNTVIYPAMIGKTAKFETFHEFIDYVNQEISQLNLFKNKSSLDSMTSFKKKVDGTLETFKLVINNLTPKEVTEHMINDLDQKFNNALKIYDDRLQDTRVENSHYSKGIEKKAEELDKQIENLKHAHNIIKQKIEQIQNLENFNSLNNELFSTNQKINKIFDILRDLVTYHPDVKKNYLTEFEKKPSKKIISGVRQYIKGNLNANELSTMKKFAFEKSKTKIYDKTYPVPKATQSPPENLYNSNYPAQKRQYLFIEPKNTNNDLNVINKKFMSKKTANYSKQENIMSYKFVDTENISRKTFNRKKTYNYGKTDANTETSKMNDFLRSPNKNIDFISREQTKRTQNIIEEENEVNNISNNSNNEINNKRLSLHFDKNESNQEKKEKNDSISFLKDDDEDKNKNIDEIIIKDDNNKNNSINILEKDILNNNNINKEIMNFNKKKDENKKVTLTLNINKKYNQSPEPKLQSKEKEKEVKNSIITETEKINSHARNNKILILDNNTETKKSEFLQPLNTNIKVISNLNNKKNSANKTQIRPKSNTKEKEKNKNKTLEDNKILIPIKYNFQSKNPDINILSIKKKMFKTFNNNFPKIKQDISETKSKINNNISFPTSKESYTKTLNKDEFYKKDTYNVVSPNLYQKKILLMNPDELPLNFFDKKYKDLINNNPILSGYLSERIKKNKNKEINSVKEKDNYYSNFDK